MKIESIRPSFLIAFLHQGHSSSAQIESDIAQTGYQVRSFEHYDQAIESFREDPPHQLLVYYDPSMLTKMKKLLDLLPELHLLVLCDSEEYSAAREWIGFGAADVLTWPETSVPHLIRSIDRGAERDYYLYMNEQLREEMEETTPIATLGEVESLPSTRDGEWEEMEKWLGQLQTCANTRLVIEHFMNYCSQSLNGAQVFYLRYYSSRQSLMASQSVGLQEEVMRGLGVDLQQMEEDFHSMKLRYPMNLVSLRQLIGSALEAQDYMAFSLITNDGIKGIFVLMGSAAEEFVESPNFRTHLQAAISMIERVELERKFHTVNLQDDVTAVLNRHSFMRVVGEEVSRARRLQMPVSVVLVSVDESVAEEVLKGSEDFDLLLKMLVGIVRKNSRVNDIIGRIGKEEFGILLPHTGQRGAAVKAERLRRIIESADFSRVLGRSPTITVSLGASEYPGLCQDADELMQTADEALFTVKSSSGNKVCLAAMPENFTPDFISDRL